MPDTAFLLLGLLFSSIGIGYLVYGRRQNNKMALLCGLGLLVYPYFMSSLVALVGVGVGLMVLPRFVKL